MTTRTDRHRCRARRRTGSPRHGTLGVANRGPLAALTLAALVTASAAAAETTAVEGADLRYVSDGEGTPVVFVHGAISDHRVWEPYRERIARNHRFIAYDQRYFGTDEWPDEAEHFSIDTHADDLVALLEALEDEPAHVVTWSYSGDVASRAVLRRPDLFRSLIHFEPAVGSLMAGLPGASRATGEMFSRFGPAMLAVEEGRLEDSALRFLDAVFDLPEGAADDEPEPWPTIWRDNGRTVPPYLASPEGESVSCAALADVRVPTLVVQGGRSFTRYSMMAERVADCQPNAVIVTLAGVNHDGPYRKPEEFGEMIERFVALIE